MDEKDLPVAYGSDLFYECSICGDLLPTEPQQQAVSCKCYNIILDWDAGRFLVKEPEKAQIRQIR